MAAAPSRCAAYAGCFVGGRRRAALDDIDQGAVAVTTRFTMIVRAMIVVRRPLPLFPVVTALPRFASLCAGTPSAASPRCWGVPLDKINRPGWAGRRWALRWALRQFWLRYVLWCSILWRLQFRVIVGDSARCAVARASDAGGVYGSRTFIVPYRVPL